MFFRFNAGQMPVITHMNRNTVPEGWKHFSRTAEEYILYLVESGELHLTEDGCQYSLQPGDAVLLEPGRTHSGWRESACRYAYVHFSRDAFTPFDCARKEDIDRRLAENRSLLYTCNPFGSELYEKTSLFLPKLLKVQDQARLLQIGQCMDDAIRSSGQKADHYKLLCSCKAVEVLALLSGEFTTQSLHGGNPASPIQRNSRKVNAVLHLLHAEYATPIDGDAIAQRLGFHFDYLNRVFRRQVGMTIFEYLNVLRVNKAKELLLHGSMRLHEIAAAVGFSDEYRLCKVFKKIVGTTPRRFH